MRKISADYVFPVSKAPVRNGVLITEDNGKIINLIDPKSLDYELKDVEYFKGFIMPGFINAHCHIELSYLKGKIKRHKGLDDFLFTLSEKRNQYNDEKILKSIEAAEEEMLENGIVAVGDVLNSDITFEKKKKSKLAYHNFVEVFGSNPLSSKRICTEALVLYRKFYELSDSSIVPHSAYSVSEQLFKKIKQFASNTNCILTIHHQESKEENLFFLDKSGKIPARAKKQGIDLSEFKPTGLRPLVSVSDFLPYKNHLQLVHNTYADKEDIDFAKNKFRELYWCFCPNSNLYIENKLADIKLFVENNCKITLGTDSLASNEKLSILEEINIIHWSYPDIELNELIKWATLNGAEYLNMEDNYGSFDRGKMPGINLIEQVDTDNLKVLNKSKISSLVH